MADQAPTFPRVVVPLASRGAGSGDSGPLSKYGGRKDIAAKLVVTAVTGDVVITVEESADGISGWTPIDTFPAQATTTPGVTRVAPSGSEPYLRVAWTVNTGPVTFSVTLAHTGANMLLD